MKQSGLACFESSKDAIVHFHKLYRHGLIHKEAETLVGLVAWFFHMIFGRIREARTDKGLQSVCHFFGVFSPKPSDLKAAQIIEFAEHENSLDDEDQYSGIIRQKTELLKKKQKMFKQKRRELSWKEDILLRLNSKKNYSENLNLKNIINNSRKQADVAEMLFGQSRGAKKCLRDIKGRLERERDLIEEKAELHGLSPQEQEDVAMISDLIVREVRQPLNQAFQRRFSGKLKFDKFCISLCDGIEVEKRGKKSQEWYLPLKNTRNNLLLVAKQVNKEEKTPFSIFDQIPSNEQDPHFINFPNLILLLAANLQLIERISDLKTPNPNPQHTEFLKLLIIKLAKHYFPENVINSLVSLQDLECTFAENINQIDDFSMDVTNFFRIYDRSGTVVAFLVEKLVLSLVNKKEKVVDSEFVNLFDDSLTVVEETFDGVKFVHKLLLFMYLGHFELGVKANPFNSNKEKVFRKFISKKRGFFNVKKSFFEKDEHGLNSKRHENAYFFDKKMLLIYSLFNQQHTNQGNDIPFTKKNTFLNDLLFSLYFLNTNKKIEPTLDQNNPKNTKFTNKPSTKFSKKMEYLYKNNQEYIFFSDEDLAESKNERESGASTLECIWMLRILLFWISNINLGVKSKVKSKSMKKHYFGHINKFGFGNLPLFKHFIPIVDDLFEIDPQALIHKFTKKKGLTPSTNMIHRIDLILRQSLDFADYFEWCQSQQKKVKNCLYIIKQLLIFY